MIDLLDARLGVEFRYEVLYRGGTIATTNASRHIPNSSSHAGLGGWSSMMVERPMVHAFYRQAAPRPVACTRSTVRRAAARFPRTAWRCGFRLQGPVLQCAARPDLATVFRLAKRF